MAVTLTEGKTNDIGNGEVLVRGTIAFDNSYVTLGEPVDATGDVGYSDLWTTGTNGGYLASWDASAQKVVMYRQSAATSALTEVANAVDLSAVTVRYAAIRPR